MFKTLSEISNRPRNLGIDGIALAAGRSCMVRLIQNQEAARPECSQPIGQRSCIGLIDQQTMRDQESGVRSPGVDPKTTFPTNILNVVLIQNFKMQSEAAVQLLLPLEKHRRRTGYDDVAYLLSEKQFTGNQSGFNCLSDANIIRDKEVNPRQQQSLAQGFQLIRVKAYSCPKGRLQQFGVS